MKRSVIFLLMVSALAASGCRTSLLSSRSHEKQNVDEQEQDRWVAEAGDYTRKVHPRDEVKDPLHLRDVFTSDKAREIERNLGVGP